MTRGRGGGAGRRVHRAGLPLYGRWFLVLFHFVNRQRSGLRGEPAERGNVQRVGTRGRPVDQCSLKFFSLSGRQPSSPCVAPARDRLRGGERVGVGKKSTPPLPIPRSPPPTPPSRGPSADVAYVEALAVALKRVEVGEGWGEGGGGGRKEGKVLAVIQAVSDVPALPFPIPLLLLSKNSPPRCRSDKS